MVEAWSPFFYTKMSITALFRMSSRGFINDLESISNKGNSNTCDNKNISYYDATFPGNAC
jgi:hypothetical protein